MDNTVLMVLGGLGVFLLHMTLILRFTGREKLSFVTLLIKKLFLVLLGMIVLVLIVSLIKVIWLSVDYASSRVIEDALSYITELFRNEDEW